MTTATTTRTRDIAADLIGGPATSKKPVKASGNKPTAKKKAAAKKAATKAPSASDRTVYDDSKKIKLSGDWKPRAGARTEKIFKALRASKTVGQFRAARERMGLTGVGKLFVQLIDKKVLRLQ